MGHRFALVLLALGLAITAFVFMDVDKSWLVQPSSEPVGVDAFLAKLQQCHKRGCACHTGPQTTRWLEADTKFPAAPLSLWLQRVGQMVGGVCGHIVHLQHPGSVLLCKPTSLTTQRQVW
jgi:hypothetical protein